MPALFEKRNAERRETAAFPSRSIDIDIEQDLAFAAFLLQRQENS
jgi:CMP-N-acetylneuraminic acid synthetase